MPINQRYRTRELYIVTVKHAGHTSVIELPENYTAEDAARHMLALFEKHKPFVDSPIADHGKPQYRLWKLWGSADKGDLETA